MLAIDCKETLDIAEDSASDFESEFIADYRRGALRPALCAAVASGTVYGAFFWVALLSEESDPIALVVRGVLVVVLLSFAWVFYARQDWATKNFPVLAGSASVFALGGAAFLLTIGSNGGPGTQSGATPALIFGLFLHYAFLRLPVGAAAAIGCLASLAAWLWGSPMVVGGNESVRTLLYMAFTNIAGVSLSISLQARERDLFLQRRRAEAAQIELDRRARAAEEADREKTRLLAAVSHDLRQPIMASLTFVDVLKNKLDKQDYAQVRRQAEHITSSIQMLGATLDHLLTAARYDSGTEPIRIEAVDLGVVLERLKLAFLDEARTRGLELRVRMPKRRLIVTSDATALWRVLMNLVANALKFTPPDAARRRGVVVSATLRGGTCHVHVVDTGIGIAREHQELIWQPYMQLANEERNRQRGLGLGLFLVRRALDRVPGHAIALRSAPGRGSRFTVTMPGLWVGEPAPLHQGEVRLAESDLALMRGAHVLVIEDDRDARRAFQELFDDWGVLYSSGATLEEVLRDNESAELDVDAIVTDYRLPGARNGVECIVELRRVLATEAPAIVVTGEADLAPIGRALPGRTTLLQKPFDTLALAAPLIEAIRLARGGERA